MSYRKDIGYILCHQYLLLNYFIIKSGNVTNTHDKYGLFIIYLKDQYTFFFNIYSHLK